MPGGGTGRPSCALTFSNTIPSHGFSALGPHTATAARPPARSTRYLAHGQGRFGCEHQPLAAEHDVEGRVAGIDRLHAERHGRHVGEAAGGGPASGDGGHLGRHVGDDDLPRADECRRGEADVACPARQLEYAIAPRRAGLVEHLSGQMRAANSTKSACVPAR
jgi:hypothetical protein